MPSAAEQVLDEVLRAVEHLVAARALLAYFGVASPPDHTPQIRRLHALCQRHAEAAEASLDRVLADVHRWGSALPDPDIRL